MGTSENRLASCQAFGKCGACTKLSTPYEEQLEQKQRQISDMFSALCTEEQILPIIGAEDPYHYRNKSIFPLVYQKGSKKGPKKGARRKIVTGMYQQGTHRVVDTSKCLLEDEVAKRVANAVIGIMMRYGIEPYDEDSGIGFLRHIVVRKAYKTGEVLVTLVTNDDKFPYSRSFCKQLVKAVPEVTSIVQNVNTRNTNVILGEGERTLYGPGFILDDLCGLSFRISSQSFYQVNAKQAERLYDAALDMARIEPETILLDAYCGTGTIGLVGASRGAKRVIGVDCVRSAISDAKSNAAHNGISTSEFICEDATKFMREAAKGSYVTTDDLVALMDPPRSGSTPEFLDALCELSPKRVVYISCNPKTQLRDVRHLLERGYRIDGVQPVDMFPHTDHIENIVSMVR